MLLGMRTFATLMVLLLAWLAAGPAAAARIETRALSLCRDVDGDLVCERLRYGPMPLKTGEYLLVAQVTVPPEEARSDRPIMVVLTGMVASEVRWNGRVIGTNGRPGPDRASEEPGRFYARFVVPAEQVRAGLNTATARISSNHLPLPVGNPVHEFHVAPYNAEPTWGLSAYLPALLMLGFLAVGGIYFAVAAVLDRGQKDAGLLAAIAGLGVVQLAVETVRVFVNYLYPWHVVRVAAIAVLAAAAAVLVTVWATRRFGTARARWVIGAVAVVCVACILGNPGYDGKATWSILAGLAALGGCAADGTRRRVPGAWPALGFAAVAIGLWFWQDSLFLDQGYYVLMAAALAVLIAGQVFALARARAERGLEADRASALQETLTRREAATAAVRDGTRTHRVPTASILALQAADDYCEVHLDDGRRLLSTASLTQTLADLPGEFVRVHKSWAVNADHVAMVGPRPGGRRAVTLSDGAVVPVGRAYAEAVARFAPGGVVAPPPAGVTPAGGST